MRGRTACRLQVRQLSGGLRTVALGQVFQNGTRLGHDQLAIGQHRRLAQRMDFFQLWRGQTGGRIALVAAQLVRHAQLF